MTLYNLNKISYGKKGRGVVVGIVDSGIDTNIPDLKNVVVRSKQFWKKTGETLPYSHGTQIGSIISAQSHNDFGVAGKAPNAHIVSANVLDESGQGATLQELASGIRWLADQNVDIINISLATQETNEKLNGAIQYALSKKIFVVPAAGNRFGKSASYPAKIKNVLSVGAIDWAGKPLEISSAGKIDVQAVGQDIPTLENNKVTKIDTGTSYAAAVVSGYIANQLSNGKKIKSISNMLIFKDVGGIN